MSEQERDYFIITDENGVIIGTREIRKGVVTADDIAKDFLEYREKVIIIDATKEECQDARTKGALVASEPVIAKVEEQKKKGKVYERQKS